MNNELDYYKQFEPPRKTVKSRCVELLSSVELVAQEFDSLSEEDERLVIAFKDADALSVTDFK